MVNSLISKTFGAVFCIFAFGITSDALAQNTKPATLRKPIELKKLGVPIKSVVDSPEKDSGEMFKANKLPDDPDDEVKKKATVPKNKSVTPSKAEKNDKADAKNVGKNAKDSSESGGKAVANENEDSSVNSILEDDADAEPTKKARKRKRRSRRREAKKADGEAPKGRAAVEEAMDL